MKHVLFALVVLVTGCSTMKEIKPIPREGVITREITWVITDDPQAFCNEARNAGPNYQFSTSMGNGMYRASSAPLIGKELSCAKLSGDSKKCTIYVKPPRNEDDRIGQYLLGHEALHCFVGQFHYSLN